MLYVGMNYFVLTMPWLARELIKKPAAALIRATTSGLHNPRPLMLAAHGYSP
jgi:hypothetical protein